jgi:hypothetical protein
MSRFIEQRPTSWVAEHVSGAKPVLRRHGIAPDSRMTLDTAAMTAGVAPDALLAEIGYRERLAARKLSKARRERELEFSL